MTSHPSHVLAYHHYSVVFNAERRLAFYTAVNIDGGLTLRLKRETDNWKKDPRIPADVQAGEELYANNDFDRGHLVRRLDPAWGESRQVAKVANDDTFHFTNCSPQQKLFNQGQSLWAGLEDYILNNADNSDLKVTVFNGPVFGDHDQSYRGVLIPKEYWKVAVMVKTDGALSATAYVVSQANLIASMTDEEFVFGKYRTFQVPIATIEKKTGLSFGKLRNFDPLAAGTSHESAIASARLISVPSSVVL
jgi:endonuclease G